MKNIYTRLGSALRYLSWSNPVYKWRLMKSLCPNCNGEYFLSLGSDAFMTRCLKCRANITNLSLIPVVKTHLTSHKVVTCWEMSTYGATLNFLKKSFKIVYESEYFPDKDSGEIIDGIMNQDVQSLSFQDFSIDLITSNQVFEHVPNYIRGFKECYRVLQKGGALIFSVPLYDSPSTEKLAEIFDGKIIFYSSPEYHDSRTAGPKSALTFWRHSKHDICKKLMEVGFDAEIVYVTLPDLTIFPTPVVYAVKN